MSDKNVSQFKKGLSINAKLFLIIIACSSIIAGIASYLIYEELSQTLFQNLRNELIATARTAAATIDTDKHIYLQKTRNEHSKQYKEIKDQLKKIRNANKKIRYIYTMARTDKPMVWEFIVDAEENPKLVSHLGDQLNISDYPDMQNAFIKPTADTSFTKDKWGIWLSGYAPIIDKNGKTIAIVGIDMSAKEVVNTLKQEKLRLVYPIVLLFTIPALIGWLVSQKAIQSIKEMISTAKKIADGDYDQKIQIKTRDEIGELAYAMNAMAENIRKKVGSSTTMAIIDNLTDLFNHRYFLDQLRLEIKKANIKEQPISLIIMDVDEFSLFNKINGETYGDIALKQIANIVRNSIRETDIAARYAGEEFFIMLPDTDTANAKKIAQRLQEEISLYQFSTKNNISIPITVSMGIVNFPAHGESCEELVEAAYSALLKAKKKGKNQIFVCKLACKAKKNSPIARMYKDQSYKDAILSAVFSLAKAVDARDHYTHKHSEFVAAHSTKLGKELGLSEEDITNLSIASILHDIGKIGVPDAVLNKPKKLNKAEWEFMRQHPILGAEIVENIQGLSRSIDQAILYHHEKFDGSGYPYGLSGNDIPLFARIICIVDSFHAMISDRPYRKGMPYKEAIEELKRCKGSQFDPELVDIFISTMEKEKYSQFEEENKKDKPA